MAAVLWLSCFLKHLLRIEKRYLSLETPYFGPRLENFFMRKPGIEVKSQLVLWSVVGLREYFKFLPQLQYIIPISERTVQSEH